MLTILQDREQVVRISQEMYQLLEIRNYLAGAAASDGPIDGKERDLLQHLLRDFGAEYGQARTMVSDITEAPTSPPSLEGLSCRETALKLLRALLVISYCDGSFDPEELPFLTAVVDRFQFSPSELHRAKQQALFFLRHDFPSIRIPQELLAQQDWDRVCQLAQQHYEFYRKEFYKKFQADLDTADEESCYLAMAVGPPTFDTEYTRERFLQSNPDYLHLDDEEALTLLRDQAEAQLRKQWLASYVDRCNSCYLQAPGKRQDPCPRCGAEYGSSSGR